jgi:HD-GYP domain-containing protein (c-di-GMP phosphodiesterase class II)
MHAMAQLGANDDEIIMAGFAGKLHDVGKVDTAIRHMIRAPRKLFPEEQLEIARRHTALGASLISALNVTEEDGPLRREASMAAFFHHHPPGQLASLDPASRVVRVVQIADRFDAMQDLERPYHAEGVLTAEAAAAEIREDLEAAGVYDSLADVALSSSLEYSG